MRISLAPFIAIPLFTLSSFSYAELVALDESNLSTVSGQSGITIDSDQHLTIDEVAYEEDGNGIVLKDIELGERVDITATTDILQLIDVNEDGFFQYTLNQKNGRLNVGDIYFSNAANKSLGGLSMAFDELNAVLEVGSGGAEGQGLHGRLNSQVSNADVSWLSNGKSLELLSSNINLVMDRADSSAGFSIDIKNVDSLAWLVLSVNNLQVEFTAGKIQIGSESFGQLVSSFTLSSDLAITGGGAVAANGQSSLGEGINWRLDSYLTDGKFGYTDSSSKGLWWSGVSAEMHVENAYLDIINTSYFDSDSGLQGVDAMLLTIDEVWGHLEAEEVRLGDASSGQSFGGIKSSFWLEDSLFAISATNLSTGCWMANSFTTAGCASGGGMWMNSQNQGLHIFAKLGLSKAGSKQNSLSWIDNKSSASDTDWTEWQFTNIYTSDGLGTTTDNNYGLQADIDVHLADVDLWEHDINYNLGTVQKEGLAVQAEVRFKELVVDSLDLVKVIGGTEVSREQDHGLIMQNFNIASNITVAPIP